jgi:hypothetical protein
MARRLPTVPAAQHASPPAQRWARRGPRRAGPRGGPTRRVLLDGFVAPGAQQAGGSSSSWLVPLGGRKPSHSQPNARRLAPSRSRLGMGPDAEQSADARGRASRLWRQASARARQRRRHARGCAALPGSGGSPAAHRRRVEAVGLAKLDKALDGSQRPPHLLLTHKHSRASVCFGATRIPALRTFGRYTRSGATFCLPCCCCCRCRCRCRCRCS